MNSRRDVRRKAIQVLYGCDSLGDWSEEAMLHCLAQDEGSATTDEFIQELLSGVLMKRSEIDRAIETVSKNWRLSRMSVVDRSVLRLAVYEILFLDDIPTRVSINEAVELAKEFAADDSPRFINGILDAIANKSELASDLEVISVSDSKDDKAQVKQEKQEKQTEKSIP